MVKTQFPEQGAWFTPGQGTKIAHKKKKKKKNKENRESQPYTKTILK